MTPAQRLLTDLRGRGARCWADGGLLRWLAPPGLITPDLRARLAASKPEILALLAAEEAAIARRASAIRARVSPVEAPRPLPPAGAPVPDRCPDCGDPLAVGDAGRCSLCSLAAMRVRAETRA